METKKHVLLVDDEPDFRFSASVALRRAGYRVTEAADGTEALTKILDARKRGEMFSLLLTDITMDGMSGLALLSELNRRGILLPAIAITDCSETGMAGEIAKKGCVGHIAKPFEPRELVERIDGFLGGGIEKASLAGCSPIAE